LATLTVPPVPTPRIMALATVWAGAKFSADAQGAAPSVGHARRWPPKVVSTAVTLRATAATFVDGTPASPTTGTVTVAPAGTLRGPLLRVSMARTGVTAVKPCPAVNQPMTSTTTEADPAPTPRSMRPLVPTPTTTALAMVCPGQ
jgi:hypothetical protein